MIYEYPNIAAQPNLDGIHADVAASAMTDKDILYCLWTEADATLRVTWARALSSADKALLDEIVDERS